MLQVSVHASSCCGSSQLQGVAVMLGGVDSLIEEAVVSE